MPYSDKDKQRTFCREHLQKKKKENPKWHAELKKRHKQKRDSIHDIVNHIKSTTGCLLCDETNPHNLQFHHLLPELKVATIAQLISNRSKLITVLKEIEKCVCVCSACHRELQINVSFVRRTIEKERWYKDWGLQEALEWVNLHPQNRLKKANFLDVIKAVIRNHQFQNIKNFQHLTLLQNIK